MSTDATPLPAPPTDMVEWSRKAANLSRALARAHVHGAPAELQAHAEQLWKLASRGATLAGALETLSKAFEQLSGSGGKIRAELEQKVDANAREDIGRFEEALQTDLRAGRSAIEARVREALDCEKAFKEATSALLEQLRKKPQCRDLLEE